MAESFDYAAWVAERVELPRPWTEGFEVIGTRGPDHCAAAVFEHFTGRDIHIHLAAEGRWATQAFLHSVFWYPFVQLGCERITGFVSDPEYLSFYQLLGFRVEGTLREMFDDSDLILIGMLKRECRYIGNENGEEARPTIAA